MNGIEDIVYNELGKLSGLATKLKNHYLDPHCINVNYYEEQLKRNFCYWKAEDFFQAEPDIEDGTVKLTEEMVDQEFERRGLKTYRTVKGFDKNTGNYIYTEPRPYMNGVGRLEFCIQDNETPRFKLCDNFHYMSVPVHAPLDKVFDVLERLDKHLQHCLATEWLEIVKRAHKMARVYEMKDTAYNLSGQKQKDEDTRKELLEELFAKSGFDIKDDGESVKVTLLYDHDMCFNCTKKSLNVN